MNLNNRYNGARSGKCHDREDWRRRREKKRHGGALITETNNNLSSLGRIYTVRIDRRVVYVITFLTRVRFCYGRMHVTGYGCVRNSGHCS